MKRTFESLEVENLAYAYHMPGICNSDSYARHIPGICMETCFQLNEWSNSAAQLHSLTRPSAAACPAKCCSPTPPAESQAPHWLSHKNTAYGKAALPAPLRAPKTCWPAVLDPCKFIYTKTTSSKGIY